MEHIELFQIIAWATAALALLLLLTVVILYFKLKIKEVIRESRSGYAVAKMPKAAAAKKSKPTVNSNKFNSNFNDEIIDETRDLKSDETTYLNFNIIKKQIEVHTTETII